MAVPVGHNSMSECPGPCQRGSQEAYGERGRSRGADLSSLNLMTMTNLGDVGCGLESHLPQPPRFPDLLPLLVGQTHHLSCEEAEPGGGRFQSKGAPPCMV